MPNDFTLSQITHVTRNNGELHALAIRLRIWAVHRDRKLEPPKFGNSFWRWAVNVSLLLALSMQTVSNLNTRLAHICASEINTIYLVAEVVLV